MDPLLDMLQRPESKTLEYKRDLSSLDPILKTIVAFANTAGGTLLIGCSSEGIVLGIQDVLKAEEQLANCIADSIHPFILPEIEVSTVEGKPILIVRVAHWKGPFYLKKLGLPVGVFVRLGSTSRPAGPELVSEMQRTLLRSSYDEEPVPNTSLQDLDPDQLRNAFSTIAREVDQEKLLLLGVLTKFAGSTVCSVGGLLLFGKSDVRQRLFPDARVCCARFQGFETLSGDRSFGAVPAPIGLHSLEELLTGSGLEVIEELHLIGVVIGLHICSEVGLFGRDFDDAGMPRLHPVGEGVLAGLWPTKFHTGIGLHDHLTGVEETAKQG